MIATEEPRKLGHPKIRKPLNTRLTCWVSEEDGLAVQQEAERLGYATVSQYIRQHLLGIK